MGCLSQIVHPHFVRSVAIVLKSGPVTELELQRHFLHDVPNRGVSKRVLSILLELCWRAGLISLDRGIWRPEFSDDIDHAIAQCYHFWSGPEFARDELFQKRSSVCLGLGIVTATGEFLSIEDLSARGSLTPREWGKLISRSGDMRRLCDLNSTHSEADYLMIYRNLDAPPICDDQDVLPRVPVNLLPVMPCSPVVLLSSIHQAENAWRLQLSEYLGQTTLEHFDRFIIYAKELLDMLFWGASSPMKSVVSHDHLVNVSGALRRFGVRAEDLTTVWRGVASVYRQISRLSWGIRYLSNNLWRPHPPNPDVRAFLSICDLPTEKQMGISVARSGHSLMSLIRPLKILHRALGSWPGRTSLATSALDCAAAVLGDNIMDKLLRREFGERIRRLEVVSSVNILDALSCEIEAPNFPSVNDDALMSAGLISSFSGFFDSRPGSAYAEVRLGLHSELDFHGRFNRHNPNVPQRYDGVWKDGLQHLVERLEDTRRGSIRS